MSYTTPPAFPSNTIVPAADLQTLSDDIADLDARANTTSFFGVALLRTSDQSIADSSDVDISWSSEAIDAGSWWSSGTDAIVPVGAIPDGYTTIYVSISGYARFATNGTGVRSIGFLVNGAVQEQRAVVGGISGDVTYVALPEVWAEVAAGDVITAQVTQTSTGSLALQKAAMHIKRIGPANP